MGIGMIFGRCEATTPPLRDTGELTITLPALPRPTLEELKQYFAIKSIERDASPETPVTLTLVTVLKPGETSMDGAEYERRLAPKEDALLGFQHRQWLLDHQDEYPALKALFGKVYIDFPGIVVRFDDGRCGIPSCFRDGPRGDGRWYDHWRWLGHGFNRDGYVAVARKQQSAL